MEKYPALPGHYAYSLGGRGVGRSTGLEKGDGWWFIEISYILSPTSWQEGHV